MYYDLTRIVSGMYFLRIDDGRESFVFKVVKE